MPAPGVPNQSSPQTTAAPLPVLSAEALTRQGLDALKAGQLDAAIRHLHAAWQQQPDSFDIGHNLGIAYGRARQFTDAIRHLSRAVELNPTSADAQRNLGLAYVDARRLAEALPCYQRVVQLRPQSQEAHYQLGNVWRWLGRPAEAEACYRDALDFKADVAEIHHDLGLVLARQGKYQETAAAYREALRLKPDYVSALNNLALALQEINQPAESVKVLQQAVKLKPDGHEFHNNLGVALAALGKHSEAAAAYEASLRLKPNYAEAHNNLGNALRDLGRHSEAETHFFEAMRLRPEYAEAHNNLGITRVQQGRYEEAIACYTRAIELKPDYPDAYKNRGFARLGLGEWAQAWPEYEWRWRSKGFTPRSFEQPRWDGSDLSPSPHPNPPPQGGREKKKTILVHAEQGLGDTIQFIRYAALLKERGARVLFECPKALVGILGRYAGIDQLVPAESKLPEFDLQVPLLSLPGLFGTTPETIPAPGTYLTAHPEWLERWGEALRRREGFKVGIAWQGNPGFKNDHNRSIPLEKFAPLAAVPGVQLVSLQKGVGTEQLAAWQEPLGIAVLDVDREAAGRTFEDTAAIMMNLDLVISADTATAHLAGALGVPVWVPLPLANDWRWLRDREDTPWYPSMRLFRQERWADWDGVFARIADDVARTFSRDAQRSAGVDVRAPLRVAAKRDEDIAVSVVQLHDQAVALAKEGKLAHAAEIFQQVLQLNPTSVATLDGLGLALLYQGKLAEAVAAFRRALHWQPDSPEVCNNLGVALLKMRQHAAAIEQFQRAIALRPEYAEAHNNLGNVFRERGQLDAAQESYYRALHIRKEFAEAWNNLGLVYDLKKKYDLAVGSYQDAIRYKPGYVKAHINLARSLQHLPRLEEAIRSYQEGLRLDPAPAEWHHELGELLRSCGRMAEAEQSYRQAVERRPNWPEAYNRLGIAVAQQGRFEDALIEYGHALRLKPQFARVHGNRAISLANLGRMDEALAAYAEALRLDPNHAETHHNLALTLLSLGRLEEGWREHEWRLRCAAAPRAKSPSPPWDGQALAGKTILLHAEQGLGDTIQFVRYAPMVQARGGRVVLECPQGLIPTLRSCPGIHDFVAVGTPLPPHEVQSGLMSLPAIFGTTLATIPAGVPYLFPDPNLVEHWQRALRYIEAFKIGIAWQGSAAYRGDRYRSIPVQHFAPLAELDHVQLISLQKGSGVEQLSGLQGRFSVLEFAHQLDESHGAFQDTAALMQNLDLVITSDTSIAHLAGALGVHVWVALGIPCDWRWLHDRDDSPWYPSLRLFRQPRPGDWQDVFERMAQELGVSLFSLADPAREMIDPMVPVRCAEAVSFLVSSTPANGG